MAYILPLWRAVAQSGSALEWGSRGRWFESSQPDYAGCPTGFFLPIKKISLIAIPLQVV
jgi:hypothetical protein